MTNIIPLICLGFSICMFLGTKDQAYQLLFLQPLLFGLMYHCSRFLKKNQYSHIALGILFTTSFIKYVLSPFFLYLSQYPQLDIPLDDIYIEKAIILQCYEEICFFIILNYAAIKFYKTNKQTTILGGEKLVAHKNIFLYLIIIATFLIIISNPTLISRYHFIGSLIGNEEENIIKSEGTGGVELLISNCKYLLIILLLSIIYKQKKLRNSSKVILSVFIIALNSTIVYDFSRFNIIIPAVTFIYLITLIYPYYRKKIIFFSILPIGISVAYTTFIKMFSEYRGNIDDSNDIVYWANSLQVYFQGTTDIAIGLFSAEKAILSSIHAFINDAIANVALLSHFSETKFNSLYIYNFIRSGGISFDKILPNVCAGYNYFGFFGAPLIICICTFWGIKFDAISRYEQDMSSKFIYIFAAITLSLCHMIYYTMIISNLINSVLFISIILYINKKTLQY